MHPDEVSPFELGVALLSGLYKRGTGQLRTMEMGGEQHHCCLDVLRILMEAQGQEVKEELGTKPDGSPDGNQYAVLLCEDSLPSWLDMRRQLSLGRLNDDAEEIEGKWAPDGPVITELIRLDNLYREDM